MAYRFGLGPLSAIPINPILGFERLREQMTQKYKWARWLIIGEIARAMPARASISSALTGIVEVASKIDSKARFADYRH